ncbi:MAG: hypothetical protein H0V43_01845 [Gemmatimonadales bacterium]|nr:hypothetical protein [Gemmatimonadales bacterium]
MLRDITIIHEGNPDMLPAEAPGGERKVNWEKLGLLGSQLARLDEVKKRKYPFRADPRFARAFFRCVPLTEAELHHQLSMVQARAAGSGASSAGTGLPAAMGALLQQSQAAANMDRPINVITGKEAKAGTRFAKVRVHP